MNIIAVVVKFESDIFDHDSTVLDPFIAGDDIKMRLTKVEFVISTILQVKNEVELTVEGQSNVKLKSTFKSIFC